MFSRSLSLAAGSIIMVTSTEWKWRNNQALRLLFILLSVFKNV
jgi:hypothetical protein